MISVNFFKAVLVTFLVVTNLAGGCRHTTGPPPPEPEPLFKPGEYGGEELDGTEHLYNLQLSPDGTKMALIRAYTPGRPLDPRDQIWIVNADGTDPELIGYNVSTADWSPDGQKLAVSFVIGFHNTYVITFNVDTKDSVRIWTGLEDKYLYEQTTSNPRWFNDGKQLLVSVWGKAYKQTYTRGVYTIRTSNQVVEGPLIKIAAGAFLGNNEKYFISSKYTIEDNPKSGNFIRYNFDTKNWDWVTDFSRDSLNRWAKLPRPNPSREELIFAKHKENAWQLFMMDSEGNNRRQLTELGGSEVSWSKDGQYVYFSRDVHKAPGARYVPYYYELATGEIEALWPTLPDSVPQFPVLQSQSPIDFLQIVQDSTQATDNKN